MLLRPVEGSGEGVRRVADAVEATGRRLADAASTLTRLRAGAVWDGPAGEAFSQRMASAPTVLDRAADRFLGAARPMRELAAVLDDAQAVAQQAVDAHDEAWEWYRVLEERAVVLVGRGVAETSPELLAVRHAQQEQMAEVARAEARHAAALDGLRAADARCTAALRALADDDLVDPWLYRGLRTTSSVGHGVGYLAMLPARVAPECAVAGLVGEGVGTLADGALLVGYGEGGWRELGVSAGAWALGATGQTMRRGATAGTVLRADGGVAARTLTTQERLLAGAVTTARERVAAARARFAPLPSGGTPSALVGGPAVRAPGPRGLTGAAGGGPRAVRRRVASARTGLRMVGAGGPQTVRMYAAGVSLGAGGRLLPHVVPEPPALRPQRPASLTGADRVETRTTSW